MSDHLYYYFSNAAALREHCEAYGYFPRRKADALAAMTHCARHPSQAAIKAAWVEPVETRKPFVAGLFKVAA